MASRTYLVSGSIANAAGFTLPAPPAGYVRFLSPSGLCQSTADALQLLHPSLSTTGHVMPLYSSDHKLFQVWDSSAPLRLFNSHTSSVSYTITGDEVPIGEAGGFESVLLVTASIANTAPAASLLNWAGGKAFEVMGYTQSTTLRVALRDATSKVQYAFLPILGGVRARGFVLWPELNLELFFANPNAATTGEASLRALQYVDTNVPEYANKLVMDESIAGSGSINIQPPPGEIWYVDVWMDPTFFEIYDKGTTITNNKPTKLRVSNESWVQFRNINATAKRLVLIGTRGTA